MDHEPHRNISLLRIYFSFRTLLAIVLSGMFFTEAGSDVLGTLHPKLYMWTGIFYVAICMATIASFIFLKVTQSFNRVFASLVIDAATVVLFIHTSGGMESGLGYLLIVFVAMGSMFVRGQLGIAYAAMTSIMIMAQSLYLSQVVDSSTKELFSAGSLGVLLFCTAFTFQFLTEKIRVSNLEAAAQAEFAAQLQRMAQSIVARMRTGIIVIDEQRRIELINESALQLMDLPQKQDYRNRKLDDIENFQAIIDDWQYLYSGGPPKVYPLGDGHQARVSLSVLELGAHSRTVIYMEDHRVMTQQAQQLKLASLGRLTASIAHEIRNPLGAISHAAQLLAESPNIKDEDVRLTEIINHHSNRVNQIVESTLAMSRRKDPQPETLDLSQWLPNFISQYKLAHQPLIELNVSSASHLVKMDPTHISQVLTNLLDNGLRYGHKATGEHRIKIQLKKSSNDDTSFMDIIDFGEGISDESLPHIFDPFYTTDEKGSGLGLYISKELCEINQASLIYRRTDAGESCFRINFSHHQRMF